MGLKSKDISLLLFSTILSIANIKIVKILICKYNKIVSVGNNFVFIYIPLSVGVWWRVGNTKLLKPKNHKNV
jgi:hypothetical protein